MAIALVNSWTGLNNGSGPSGSPLSTTNRDSAGADLIVVCVSANGAITSITDTESNVYSLATGSPFANGGGDQVSFYYTYAPTTDATHAIIANWSGTVVVGLTAACYSGLVTSPFDQHHEGTGNSSSLDSGATSTTAVNTELLICGGTMSSGTDLTFTGTGGFTARSQSGQASISTTVFLADQIVSSTGTYNGTASCTQSGNWACGIITFKGEVGGGGGVNNAITWIRA